MMWLIIRVIAGKINVIRRVRATVHFNYGHLIFSVSIQQQSPFVKVQEGLGAWHTNYITLMTQDCRGLRIMNADDTRHNCDDSKNERSDWGGGGQNSKLAMQWLPDEKQWQKTWIVNHPENHTWRLSRECVLQWYIEADWRFVVFWNSTIILHKNYFERFRCTRNNIHVYW
jgi:hypothetical protein